MSAVALKGENGAVIETGTTALTGDFEAITFLADSTFSTFTSSTITGDSVTSGPLTFPAGLTIFGRWSALTLASGAIIAYKRGNI